MEFKKEQSDMEIYIIESSLGRTICATLNPKWVEYQNMITKIVYEKTFRNYGERKNDDEVLDYLHTLSYYILI